MGFDSYGRLNSLTQDFTGASADLTLTYGLNEASQLISKAFSNASYISHPSTAAKAYVTGGPNNYTSVAGTTYTYDGRKNLTSDGARTFTYDSENRLLTASAPTAVTLTYDPLGRLQTSATSAATTTFLYAGSFLAAEYNGSTVTQRYVPDPSGSEPVVWYQGSGTSTPQSVQTDELGSVIATSNASGANSATYGYGPNGEPGGGWTGSRYSYTGQTMIPEAQVYYYKNRVYDPVIGRFLQTDPIGYSGGMNLYAYAANDPINYNDPAGTELAGAIVGVVVGGVTGGITAAIQTSSNGHVDWAAVGAGAASGAVSGGFIGALDVSGGFLTVVAIQAGVGGVAGAGGDFLGQELTNLFEGRSPSNINVGELVGAGIGGFIGGGFGGGVADKVGKALGRSSGSWIPSSLGALQTIVPTIGGTLVGASTGGQITIQDTTVDNSWSTAPGGWVTVGPATVTEPDGSTSTIVTNGNTLFDDPASYLNVVLDQKGK